jgi:DNA polymerase
MTRVAEASDKIPNKIKARARLALRAERAFGVNSVVRSRAIPQAAPQAEIAKEISVAPSETKLTVPAMAPSPAQQPGDLFGKPATNQSSQRGLVPPQSVEAFTGKPLPTAEKIARLTALDVNEVRGCTQCRLCEKRTNTVFGEGDPDAKIMFIGEGPGENEDLQGRPFIGRAGELLTKMIIGMGLQREQVYICNIVKCRPPQNREPAPDEVATCTPFLERQIEIIRPRVIVTLGRPALQHMLQQKVTITRMRGQWLTWRGIRLMPTFHPAYILRNYTTQTREAVWSDLQQVMQEIGLPTTSKKRSE